MPTVRELFLRAFIVPRFMLYLVMTGCLWPGEESVEGSA